MEKASSPKVNWPGTVSHLVIAGFGLYHQLLRGQHLLPAFTLVLQKLDLASLFVEQLLALLVVDQAQAQPLLHQA